MVKKLQYQAISRTLFVPAATIAVFSSFSQPAPARLNIAVSTANAVNTPSRPTSAPAVFSSFAQPVQRKSQPQSFTNAPQPRPAQSFVFGQFSQPQFARTNLPDEQPSALFEVLPPQAPPFTGFAKFEGIQRAKFNVALFSDFKFTIFPIPVDTHDGVWVKRKRKRLGPDPIEIELAEKASRRAALELAVYGPEVQYSESSPVFEALPPKPINVAELAKVMAAAQQAHYQAQRSRDEHDEEDDLESILREIL